MKKNEVKRIAALFSIMLLSLVNAGCAMAQAKVADKEIIGVWIMKSMKWEGEDKEYINDSYNQVKVYRANGEYACAEIVKSKDGTYTIMPHEYGTYTMKNGMYSEMGREAIKYQWVDKVTSKGRWMNRIDLWKKVVDMPEELTQHIVDKCKSSLTSPANIQKMMQNYIFKK